MEGWRGDFSRSPNSFSLSIFPIQFSYHSPSPNSLFHSCFLFLSKVSLKRIRRGRVIGKMERDRERENGDRRRNQEREIREGVKERELSRPNPTNTCGFQPPATSEQQEEESQQASTKEHQKLHQIRKNQQPEELQSEVEPKQLCHNVLPSEVDELRS